jgi:hypothetical protein
MDGIIGGDMVRVIGEGRSVDLGRGEGVGRAMMSWS